MKKNYAQNVFVHIQNRNAVECLRHKVSQFHTDIIEQKLMDSGFTIEEKVVVLDKIIKELKERETQIDD